MIGIIMSNKVDLVKELMDLMTDNELEEVREWGKEKLYFTKKTLKPWSIDSNDKSEISFWRRHGYSNYTYAYAVIEREVLEDGSISFEASVVPMNGQGVIKKVFSDCRLAEAKAWADENLKKAGWVLL